MALTRNIIIGCLFYEMKLGEKVKLAEMHTLNTLLSIHHLPEISQLRRILLYQAVHTPKLQQRLGFGSDLGRDN